MPNSFCMIIIEATDSGTLHYKEEFLESGCFLNAENNLWSKAKTIKNGAARLCWLVSTSLISCTSQKKKKNNCLVCFWRWKNTPGPEDSFKDFALLSLDEFPVVIQSLYEVLSRHKFCINISMCLWGNLVLLPFLRYCWLDKHSSTWDTQTQTLPQSISKLQNVIKIDQRLRCSISFDLILRDPDLLSKVRLEMT